MTTVASDQTPVALVVAGSYPAADMPEGTPEVLTLKEAAEILRTSDRTVRRLIAAGELTGTEVAGKLRVLREDLAAYLKAQRAKSGDAAK